MINPVLRDNNIVWCFFLFLQELLPYLSKHAKMNVTLGSAWGIYDTLFCEVHVHIIDDFFVLFSTSITHLEYPCITADFSVVYRPGFLKYDSPVVIRPRGYHSSTSLVNDEILSVNIRLFSTKFKVKTLVAFI